jgi:polyhydroxyalkanoate synthase
MEQGMDAMTSAWQQTNEQLSQLASQWLNVANPQQNEKKQKPSSAGNKSLTDYALAFFEPTFLMALADQTTEQTQRFFEGLNAYLNSDYEAAAMDYKVLWKRGSARLLDIDPKNTDGLAVLCVPSLINKAHVLDLTPQHSFVQYLKSQGFRPLILDWGTPGEAEEQFSCGDYINGYAIPALQELREKHEGPIALVGYCMGGIFAVAMTQLAQLYVDALVLLATPWDFSAEDTPRVLLEPATQLMLRNWISMMNPVPTTVTQTVFHLIDPWRVQEKYSRFPDLSDGDKQHFLAMEQWVNDGVPLAQKVAEECFTDWPQGNILASHQWKIGRKWIEPGAITCPTLAVIPKNDLIVPMGCALPLSKEIKRCEVITPDAGHVSMVAGRRAKTEMWEPVGKWLKKKF